MKHLKHCETSWNSRHSMRRHWRSMWRRLRLWQRRRRSRGGHSIRRYRRSMRRRRRSARRRRPSRVVSGDIGDCGVGITPQMSNRVTNHGDMSTFSKPVTKETGNSHSKKADPSSSMSYDSTLWICSSDILSRNILWNTTVRGNFNTT